MTDDIRRVFAIESFGFLENGVHEMMISGVEAPSNTAGFVFMLQTPEAVNIVEESMAEGGSCLYNFLNDNAAVCASTQCTTIPLKNGAMGCRPLLQPLWWCLVCVLWLRRPVTVKVPGEYRAYFANCAGDSTVSFKVADSVHMTHIRQGECGTGEANSAEPRQ